MYKLQTSLTTIGWPVIYPRTKTKVQSKVQSKVQLRGEMVSSAQTLKYSTLDCTLVFVRGKQVWRTCVVRTHVALAFMQSMTRAHVKIKCKEKNGTFHFYCTYAFVWNQCISI